MRQIISNIFTTYPQEFLRVPSSYRLVGVAEPTTLCNLWHVLFTPKDPLKGQQDNDQSVLL